MGLSLRGQTSGAIDINAPNVAGDNTITLPGTNGAANQFYKNSGTAGIVTHSSMVEDSSGNIGIGTDNPVRKLHVSGSATQRIRLENTAASGNSVLELKLQSHTFDIGVNPTANYFSDTADQPYVWYHSSGERMRIDSSGKVGINQSSPTAFIHAKSGANDGTVIGTFEGATNNKLDIKFNSTGPALNVTAGDPLAFEIGGTERMRIDSSGNIKLTGDSPFLYLSDNDNNWIRGSSGLNQIRFGTNGSERMRIDSSGRLLVGTSTSPSAGNGQYAKLVVQGFVGGTGAAFASLQRAEAATSITTDELIGVLSFDDSSGNTFAEIAGRADGTAGTSDYPGRLVFSTTADGASSPTERMKIRNNGQSLYFSDSSFVFRTVRTGAGDAFLSFQSGSTSIENGAQKCRILADGDLENTNNNYGALSDVKLKENIVDAESQWEDLKGINIRNYNFKEELGFGTNTHIGVVAQELELVSPNLVKTIPDRDNDDNDLGTTTKSVKYSVLYMKAVKALQEAMERIETLETQNADLLARVTALEG